MSNEEAQNYETPPKRSKTDVEPNQAKPDSTLNSAQTFTIPLVAKVTFDAENGTSDIPSCQSESIERCGVKWKITLLHCNDSVVLKITAQREAQWSCEVEYSGRVFSQSVQHELLLPKHSSKMGSAPYPSRVLLLHKIRKEYLLDAAKGYIQDGAIHMEVVLTIAPGLSLGISSNEFTSGLGFATDVTFEIGGLHVFANKGYLSVESAMFAAMFAGEFAEKEKAVVPLDSVDADQFVEFLSAIYPTQTPITAQNVLFLYTLADEYIVPSLLEKCERFLIADKEISAMDKIALAVQLSKPFLKRKIIDSLTSQEIERIATTYEEKQLDVRTAMDILKRHIEVKRRNYSVHFADTP
jgi:hypothetical protein